MKFSDFFWKKKKDEPPANLHLLQIGDTPALRSWLGSLLPQIAERKQITVEAALFATQPDEDSMSTEALVEQGFFTLLKRGVRQGQVVTESHKLHIYQHVARAESHREPFFKTAQDPELDCLLVGMPQENRLLLLSWLMARYQHRETLPKHKLYVYLVHTQHLPEGPYGATFIEAAEAMRATEDFLAWLSGAVQLVDAYLDHRAKPLDPIKDKLIVETMDYEDPACLLAEHASVFFVAMPPEADAAFPPFDLQWPIFQVADYADLVAVAALEKQVMGLLQVFCCVYGLLKGHKFMADCLQDHDIKQEIQQVMEEEFLPLQTEDEPMATHLYRVSMDRAASPFQPLALDEIIFELPFFLRTYVGPFIGGYQQLEEGLPPVAVKMLAAMLQDSASKGRQCIPVCFETHGGTIDLKAAVDAFVGSVACWGDSLVGVSGLRAALLDACAQPNQKKPRE